MKRYDKKGKVVKEFKDKETNTVYEIGEDFTANRWRYDELYYKGYLTEGEEVKNKSII